jgi:Protein of unknown function (DUF4238)
MCRFSIKDTSPMNLGLLWVYDRKRKTYKHLPPQVVCFQNDFYTIFSKDGRRLRDIETEFTKPLDGNAAKALHRLASGQTLDSDARQGLAMFIGLQRTRLPSFRRAISAAIKTNVEQFVRIGFSEVERASEILARYERDTGTTIDQTPEAIVEAVRSGALTVEATEIGFLLRWSPGLRQTVKSLPTVRRNLIVQRRRCPARWRPAGEAEASPAGEQPAKE